MSTLFPDLSLFKESEKTVKVYKKGREVDNRLGSSDCVVVVSSGLLGVYTSSGSQSGVLLSQLRSGDAFGVSNLFLEEELGTRLFVIEDCLLVFIPKQVIKTKLATDPEFAISYNVYLNQKINFLLYRLSLLSLPTAKERVKAFLNIDHFNFNTKEEIASYLGISRSQLCRALSDLDKEKENL